MTPVLRSWLTFFHKWIGYPTGLFLFILFFTGALATESSELQEWMEPQTHINAPLTEKGIEGAETLFKDALQHYPNSFLRLPTQRDPVIRILHFNGHIFLGMAVNPATGAIISTKNHSGATFLVLLHSSFHLSKFYAALIEIFVFIGLLIALITGVWLHLKRFFPDLLLYRPQASQTRRLLDLHLLIGCTILPVIIIITVSATALNMHKLGLIGPHHNHHRDVKTTLHAQLPPLSPLIKEGMKEWHNIEGSFFLNTPEGLHFIRGDETQFCSTRAFITPGQKTAPNVHDCKPIALFHAVHKVRWAHNPLRHFICLIGLLGAGMTGSGLIIFYKRECRQGEKSHSHNWLCRFYKAFNDGTIMGLPFAILCLLAITRLPAPPFIELYQWEMLVFFSLWALCYVISFVTSGHNMTLYLLIIAGFSLLPLDLMTRPFTSGAVCCLTVDLCAIIIGAAAFSIVMKNRKSL